MSDPKDWSAAQLAHAYDQMLLTPPDTLGLSAAMSMLDEATFAFRSRSARVAEAHPAFGPLRSAFQRSAAQGGYSVEIWLRTVDVAGKLAAALRELGDLRIARCGKRQPWGACGLPLDDSGSCGRVHPADLGFDPSEAEP